MHLRNSIPHRSPTPATSRFRPLSWWRGLTVSRSFAPSQRLREGTKNLQIFPMHAVQSSNKSSERHLLLTNTFTHLRAL